MPANFNRMRGGRITPDGIITYGLNPYDTTQSTGVVFYTPTPFIVVNGVKMTSERYVWLSQAGILLDCVCIEAEKLTVRLTVSGRKAWPLVEAGDWKGVIDAVIAHYEAMPHQSEAVLSRIDELRWLLNRQPTHPAQPAAGGRGTRRE